MSSPNSSTGTGGEQRRQQIRQVVGECLLGRAQGELISDESVIASHPDLMPEIADELRNLRMIEQAERQADQAESSGLHIRCPHCHNPVELVDDAPLSEVHCPSCGSTFSLVDDSLRTFQAMSDQTIGHFQLMDKVGVGAYGSVWSARDTELDRTVAVKIPRKGQLSPEDSELFIREARAAAQLKHPHIVSVLEVGRHEDRIYIVTDFVQGLDLADWLTDQQATPHEAAELCVMIADALQHAHNQGIIHRDLKPSNVMLDAAGEPHLMDFGLAKREAAEITMTIEGKLLGTPAYMPPEQARGSAHDADARSDVYSLGVILFEMLTGERPFRGSTRMLLHQVLVEDAPAARTLNGRVPKDLETICAKCLEKAQDRRYQTAADLRDDLQRFLRGEPVRARPVTAIDRGWRWCKRNRLISTMTGGLATAIVLGFIGVASQWIRAEARTNELERQLYINQIGLAYGEWRANNVALASSLLQETSERLRGWEWEYCNRLCHSELMTLDPGPTLGQSAISPLAGMMDVAFSPDGKLLAAGNEDGDVQIWDQDSKRLIRTLKGHQDVVFSVAFNADGTRLVSGSKDKSIRVWDVPAGKLIRSITGHTAWVFSVAFSPDGKYILSASGGHTGYGRGEAKLWSAETGAELTDYREREPYAVTDAVFIPKGQRVVTGNVVGAVSLWDMREGTLLHNLSGGAKRFGKGVTSLAISADGKRLVAGSQDGTLRVWDLDSLQQIQLIRAHTFYVNRVSFSPDGRHVASASGDNSVKLWDIAEAREVASLRGHNGVVHSVAFSPDGRRIGTCGEDHTIRIWDATVPGEASSYDNPLGWDFGIGFSPDSRVLAVAGWGGVKLLDSQNGAPLFVLPERAQSSVAFGPGGSQIASGGEDGVIRVWDLQSRRILMQLHGHTGPVRSIDIHSSGSQLVSGGDDATVRLWDLATGALKTTLSEHKQPVVSVRFGPSGGLIVSAGQDNTVRLWDTVNGALLHTFQDVPRPPSDRYGNSLAFSPTGNELAAATHDGKVIIWNLHSREKTLTLKGHSKPVHGITFHPNGRRIATASEDRTIKLWDSASGANVFTIRGKTEWMSVAFSSNGDKLAACGVGGISMIWDTVQSR